MRRAWFLTRLGGPLAFARQNGFGLGARSLELGHDAPHGPPFVPHRRRPPRPGGVLVQSKGGANVFGDLRGRDISVRSASGDSTRVDLRPREVSGRAGSPRPWPRARLPSSDASDSPRGPRTHTRS